MTRSGLIGVVMVVVVVMVGASRDPRKKPRCQLMRSECRVKIWDDDDGELKRNISCYCKHGEEVSGALNQLTRVTCMNMGGSDVTTSILHIKGCTVNKKLFPRSLLHSCRLSPHFVLHLEDCPWVSIASQHDTHAQPRIGNTAAPSSPDTITATFINSNVSGIPEGVLSGASVKAKVVVRGGQIGVVETSAFSSYPSNAYVSLNFDNTNILTIKGGAFDLPPTARMEINGGQVLKLEAHGYSGGSELILNKVRLGNLLPSCINVFGVRKLHMKNCTMAAVYAEALAHRPTTYTRHVTAGQMVLEGSEAVFEDNNIMTSNGQAFIHLCTVETVVWKDNILSTDTGLPFRLQGPDCYTKRNWNQVFNKNGLNCMHCSRFNGADKQTCALYKTGYCITCEDELDQCHKPILPYLTSKCAHTHPTVTAELNNTCGLNEATSRLRTPKKLKIEEQGGNDNANGCGGGGIKGILYLVVLCLVVVCKCC